MKEKKNEGITLIALVITIIVLLILAGVTIATLFGNNGILTESRLAVEANKEANAKEQVQLAWTACETEYQSAWTQDSNVEKSTFFDSDDLNKNLGTGKVNSVDYVENGKSTVTYTLDGTEYKFEIVNGQIYKVGEAPNVTKPKEKPNGPGSAEGSSAEWEFDTETHTLLGMKVNTSGIYAFNTSKIIVPSSVDGVPVKEIEYLYNKKGNFGDGESGGGSAPQEVIISNGIEKIKSSFCNLETITKIEIPNSVKEIGAYAFLRTGIENLVVPGNVKILDDLCFGECPNLKTVVIEEGVEQFKYTPFKSCSKLESIKLPSTLTDIGKTQYYGSQFQCCTALKTIIIDENNAVYDSRNNCNAIIEKSTNKLIAGCQNTIIPNNVEIIGKSAFTDCEYLTNITIPSSVKTIEEDAFCYSGLTNITIENGLTTIEDYAFEYCQNLTNITIPSSVTSIGSQAFTGCDKLTDVYIEGNTLSSDSPNYPWGIDASKIHFE